MTTGPRQPGILSARAVARYLLDRRLIDRRSIVEGDLRVVDASRRNHNFQIVRERGPSYLVKQGIGADKRESVALEASVYRLLRESDSAARLRRYLARFIDHDEGWQLLVLELIEDGETLSDYHTRRGYFSKTLASHLGTCLAWLHALDTSKARRAIPVLGHQPPWALSLHRPELDMLHRMSGGCRKLLRIVQQFPRFGEALDRLRREWRCDRLIHGDVRWDNCIVHPLPGSCRYTQFKLIDWELAMVGDPAWDVGSALANFLVFWLHSIPISGEDPPDRYLDLARYPLSSMQPALRALWVAYRRNSDFAAAVGDRLLLRATRYAAVVLLQAAFERVQHLPQLPGTVVGQLQLSLNMLERPLEAAAHLLGITPATVAIPDAS